MKLNKNTVHFYPLLAIMIGLLGCPPSGPDPVVDTGDTGAAISEDEDEDGFTVADGDCDDSNPSVYPGAEELCDGLDSDCDGLLPVDDSDTDQDEDGFSACADDCDDLNGLIHPAAVDIPGDGIDQDCDGDDTLGTSPGEDEDEDGFTVADGDCDDSNPSVYPGAEELCDGLDSDCDGLLPVDDPDTDQDFDGFSACAGDCDDLNGLIHPAAVEIPGDGIDQNCDGEDAIASSTGEDEDEDGFTVADGDCDDSNPSVYPGAEELCDGLDNDCDGLLPVDDPDTDVDGDGFSACTEDCDDLDPFTYPDAVDIPGDGIDQDCNGEDAVE